MKRIFLATLALLAFASCSNNDDETNIAIEGSDARLNVSVKSPVLGKAAGISVTSDQVNNFKVFVTDSSGEIAWVAYSNNGANLTGQNAVPVATNAQHVFVIANAGDIAITTKTGLDAYIANLGNAGAGSQTAMRWATGSTSTPLSFTQSGDDFTAIANISLTFISARITLKINNSMTGYDGTASDGSLVLKNVSVLNARSQSKLFGSNLLVSPKLYLSGLDGSSFSIWPDPSVVTLSSDFKDDIAADDFSSTYYYYVFENDASSSSQFPTIITLVGEFNGENVYYPIHLADYEQWSSGSNSDGYNFIERGKSYDISLNLTVDPSNPGGTTDPSLPLITANVEVIVTLTPWIPVVLEKEI